MAFVCAAGPDYCVPPKLIELYNVIAPNDYGPKSLLIKGVHVSSKSKNARPEYHAAHRPIS